MNKFLAAIALVGVTTAAHAADWTSLFKHYERGQDIEKATVMSDFFWSATVCMNSIEELKECTSGDGKITNKKPKLPAKYAKDLVGKPKLTADGEWVYFSVKGATLYGLPIKGFEFGSYLGEDALGRVDFGPMTQKQFNQLKGKAKFAESWDLGYVYDEVENAYYEVEDCYPYAVFKRVNGRGLLWFNPYFGGETTMTAQDIAAWEAKNKAEGCKR
ncbi:hypothetical protein [Moraxella canis]|uniref:Uncharacterized protein n=1 Tax=Moraxella canis TaxID=90239 RepID=A0A1S9ZI44_9GAMM|nr:hypothetical protein [Moraxella canis]OOR83165.1 hypothetical protein B0180_06195 [Moraxella canis]